MEVLTPKKRPRRYCEHCNAELCHTQYFDHRKRYFKNGVWEKKPKRTRSEHAQSLLLSSHEPTVGSYVQPGVGEIDEGEIKSEDQEKEVTEEHGEMRPATGGSDNGEHHIHESADDQSISLFLDSCNPESVQDNQDISCYVAASVKKEEESLDEEQSQVYPRIQDWRGNGSDQSISVKPEDLFNSPSTPLHGQQLLASPQTDEKKLLNALSGLSRQLQQQTADINERFAQLESSVLSRLLSIEERLAALESHNCTGGTDSKKKRRAHNPKIAEAVRRLHNSETNNRRYAPEQGLTSPHNEAVTSYLLREISASPDFDLDQDVIVSACKTYFETVRRSFRFSQPEHSLRAEAAKDSARSRARRKRLLESRQSVLADDEVELWKSATVELMSDEEDGVVGGVSGWIVRSPPFRSPELSELCTKLQSRLEATQKYRATHTRRLHNRPASEKREG
ncbi:uncharacterized protein LOC120808326 [Gasterosteus aculeatus]